MLKNVYKLSDGHNIVSVICNQKTIEKIVRIMMGYVNLIEEDNINTVIMNICLYEDVYEVNDDLMTENIKLHCDKDGYVYKGEPIIINNIYLQNLKIMNSLKWLDYTKESNFLMKIF